MTTVLRSLVIHGAGRTARRSVEEITNKFRLAGSLWTRRVNVGDEEVDFKYRPHSEGDLGVIEQVFGQRHYDVDGSAHGDALRAFFNKNSKDRTALIVDAGANIGASAAFFAKKYPGSQIYAIEPEPGNCRVLRANVGGLKVRLFEGALACTDGIMYLEDPGVGDWGFRVVESGAQPVQAISMSTLLRQFQAADSFPFICKIDIEGGEANLFSQNVQWVDQFPLLIIELHDWMLPFQRTSQNFIRTLANLDFETVYHGENLFCFNRRCLAQVH